MLSKNCAFLAFFFFSFGLLSQSTTVEWSTIENSRGQVIAILPKQSKDFFALRWIGGGLLGSYQLANHTNFKISAVGKLKMTANGSMATYEGIEVIGNRLVVFLSDRVEGRHILYMQEYNADMRPEGDAKELANYELEKGKSKGTFSTLSSRNKKFFGVVWEIPGKKEEKDRYGFKIFDKNLTEILDGDYKLPFEGKLSSINENYLSNTGDYFISVSEFKEPEEKRLFKSYLDYKAMHIFHITDEGLQDFTVDLNGKRVEAMTMNSDDHRIFTLTGIYGEKGSSGESGLFYLRVNFDKQEVIDQGFSEFSKEFITQDWSDKQKEKADKREEKGKGEPQLYNYKVRQAEILADGSIVGSLEKYYVVVSTYRDPRTGATSTSYTYYYNDIIAFKIGIDGEFEWLKKINKYQVSVNDGGPYSSYARYINNGKLCFVFNDNSVNYDDQGKFLDNGKIYSANFGKKKNVVAIVEIDLETGNSERKVFFDRQEIGTLAVPKLFKIDYSTNEMLLYSISGRKDRFGIMKLTN
jgi:hypothetical protein